MPSGEIEVVMSKVCLLCSIGHSLELSQTLPLAPRQTTPIAAFPQQVIGGS